MGVDTLLFGSVFTDAYLHFQNSQKANFIYMCSTFWYALYISYKK